MIEQNVGEWNYVIGKYSVINSEPNEWHLYHEGKYVAMFFERDEVLRVAIIQHTCADMVGVGIREMLKIALAEQQA
jgi:hypothetical protein